MKISGAIFDLDGTLTDSMYVWRVVGVKFLQTFGITPSEDLWERTKNLTTEQTIELFKSEYGIVWTDEEIRVGINNLVGQMYREEVLPKNGVKELLEMFRERGVKMCVASATDGYLVDLVLRKNGMRDYFSRIISCNNIGRGKDSPAIYESALEHLGTPKRETLVFEDAFFALRTAKEAGFPVVGVYDPTETHADGMRELSDYYIMDYGADKALFTG